MPEPSSLVMLQRSRRKPKLGDVIRLRFSDAEDFVVGTVVAVGAIKNPGLVVLCFFNELVPDGAPLPSMTPSELAIPPRITNRQGWLQGYFQMIGSLDPDALKSLSTLVFADHLRRPVDLHGNPVEVPVSGGPNSIGRYALDSHYTIEDDLRAALGFSPVPRD